jgi:hypothetical protein
VIFVYPSPRTHRRHGPAGYENYESYRPWLRDEFDFRCVYCLKREVWCVVRGEFEIDHFVSQANDPALGLDYDNLLYSCRSCNLAKGSNAIPDPFAYLTSDVVSVNEEGQVVSQNRECLILIRKLDLNSPHYLRWRRLLLAATDLQWRRYPDDLPDLSSLRPPLNRRPKGMEESYFAKREAGELPEIY